jgi:hypothetical protein
MLILGPTLFRLPIRNRRAICSMVKVVSWRSCVASASLRGSHLASWVKSTSVHRKRFSSAPIIASARAQLASVRIWPGLFGLNCPCRRSNNHLLKDSPPRAHPRRIPFHCAGSPSPTRRASIRRSNSLLSAEISSAMPCSPNKLSTRSQAGRWRGALKYSPKLLQGYSDSRLCGARMPARAGLRCV